MDGGRRGRRPSRTGQESLVDGVYDRILLRIVRGELGGGAELKSTQLARELGVSRTPVVQALQRLEADGIVVHEVNRRAVVRPGAENWLMEVHQLREFLEPPAAAMAAVRIGEEAVARLRGQAALARPGRRGWAAAAREFDYALHLAIADNCGNTPLGLTSLLNHSRPHTLPSNTLVSKTRSTPVSFLPAWS